MAHAANRNGSAKKVATVAPLEQDAPRTPSTHRQSVFEHVFLLSTVQEGVPQRDFHDEVRAYLDVKHLMDQSTVLLDIHSRDLEDVVRLLFEESISLREAVLYSNLQSDLFSLADCEDLHIPNLRRKLQSVIVGSENVVQDQSWVTLYCSLPDVKQSQIAFARLYGPTNMGPGMRETEFVILVVTATQEKDTKSALETARTYATLFSDAELRNKLTHVRSRDEFRSAIKKCAKRLTEAKPVEQPEHGVQLTSDVPYYLGRGIVEDFKRRIQHYSLDYTDGISDAFAIQKTISTAVFLYFCILPTAIALGMLNDENTQGKINVKKVLLGQWIGGLIFGVFGGQLFLVMLTTAPLSIYVQVIQAISTSSGYDFYKMYTCVGIWCAIFVTVMAVTEAAVVMKSLEELFGLFIAIELIYAAIDAMLVSILRYRPGCAPPNSTEFADLTERLDCDRSAGLLFVVLMTGTAWVSLCLYGFRSTPFLTKAKRELLSAYALPIGVLLMTFIGDFFFPDVPKEVFTYDEYANPLTVSAFWDQSFTAHLICAGLGFPLATLFFMDQLIVTNTVDNNENNLKKGAAANWDLLIVAGMNVLLSICALPWMHGSLPQAFLHLRAQADVEDRIVGGTVQQVIVKNRESRLAILIAHVLMIPTYFYLLPYLQLIPTSVFHGLFLYMAFSSMIGNELCERLLLIFTEQRSYPPTHYIRRVSQRVVHCFTVVEVLQLVVLLAVGFAPSPVVKMTFPVVIFLSIPLRSFVLPKVFNPRHLEVLDGVH